MTFLAYVDVSLKSKKRFLKISFLQYRSFSSFRSFHRSVTRHGSKHAHVSLSISVSLSLLQKFQHAGFRYFADN